MNVLLEVKCLNTPQIDSVVQKAKISQYRSLIILKYTKDSYLRFACIYVVQIRASIQWKAPLNGKYHSSSWNYLDVTVRFVWHLLLLEKYIRSSLLILGTNLDRYKIM